jgi:hypothetical protein
MLQCQIWGRGTGNTGEWKAPTQWTKGKQTGKSVSPYLLRVSARFFLSALLAIYYAHQIKFQWGESMACRKAVGFFLSVAAQYQCCTRDYSYSRSQTNTEC